MRQVEGMGAETQTEVSPENPPPEITLCLGATIPNRALP